MLENLNKMMACKEQAKLKYPLNIQLFAEDPKDPLVDPPTDPIDPKDPLVDSPALTQKDIDDAIAAAKLKWDDEQQLQQTEAQKLAKMTKEQREDYERKKQADTLTQREADLNKRELMSTAKETLIEKGLPVALATALDYKDADACNKSIETIGKAFQDAVQAAVEDRIKGGKTMKKATQDPDETTLEDDIKKYMGVK